MNSKQRLCLDLIQQGLVVSFVDFFYLTHRSMTAHEEIERAIIPDSLLETVYSRLSAAEFAQRRGNSEIMFRSLLQLGDLLCGKDDEEPNTPLPLETVVDFRSSIYFYEKAIECAEAQNNVAMQCEAVSRLGQAHVGAEDFKLALSAHERQLRLAQELGDEEQTKTAHKHLLQTYK